MFKAIARFFGAIFGVIAGFFFEKANAIEAENVDALVARAEAELAEQDRKNYEAAKQWLAEFFKFEQEVEDQRKRVDALEEQALKYHEVGTAQNNAQLLAKAESTAREAAAQGQILASMEETYADMKQKKAGFERTLKLTQQKMLETLRNLKLNAAEAKLARVQEKLATQFHQASSQLQTAGTDSVAARVAAIRRDAVARAKAAQELGGDTSAAEMEAEAALMDAEGKAALTNLLSRRGGQTPQRSHGV